MKLTLPTSPAVHIPRLGILLPQRKEEWAPNAHCTWHHYWMLRARTPQGYVWKGRFNDREDADAFLTAMFLGTLHLEPGLWRLPNPYWDPGLQDYDLPLVYEFTNNIPLTSGTTSWTVVSDWGNVTNSFQAIGGGGPNAGGGGAYSDLFNQTYTIGHNITVAIGAGGNAGSNTDGGDTSAKNDANSGTPLLAKGGQRGGSGPGGASGSGAGTNRFSGGTGGTPNSGAGAGGGGGAGPNGVGKNGGDGGGVAASPNGGGGGGGSDNGSAGASGSGAGGGTGGNGHGGTGGGAGGSSTSGGNATANSGGGGGGGGAPTGGALDGGAGAGSQNFDSTHGPGGGGGGGGGDDSALAPGGNGGAAGLYGGGGGSNGTGASSGAGANGANGLLFITYTPQVNKLFRLNPMMGLGSGGAFFVDPLQANRRH